MAVSNCAYAGAQAHSSRSTPIVRRTAVGIGILLKVNGECSQYRTGRV